MSNPYAWASHNPRRRIPRSIISDQISEHARRGRAVKIIGGRGMGKSVLLKDIETHLSNQRGFRAVLVPGPPEDTTVPGAVRDLSFRLGVRDLAIPRMDDLLERVLIGDTQQLVVLFDEVDQYVATGAEHEVTFTRAWFNKLEATRKQYDGMFNVVFAGGLGLFFLEREIGSGIVSRAESSILVPFTLDELSSMAEPFSRDGRALEPRCLETLLALSGGNPALATFGFERLWEVPKPSFRDLEEAFGTFRRRHGSFIRSVRSAVSQHKRLDAPWRALRVIHRYAGEVPLSRLREACAQTGPETVTIDPEQALDLLCAAGLVHVTGSPLTDPVAARPVASILNFPETAAGEGDPVSRLLKDVCEVLRNMRRFGRDFHDGDALLQEEVLSSMIAVGLRLLGWVDTDREPIQVAGFPDIKVRFTRPGFAGHAILEVKIWRQRSHNEGIQKQSDDYRMDDTQCGIAVTLGGREQEGWPAQYEDWCLTGKRHVKLETPADLVGHWKVSEADAAGTERTTHHLVVQLPKRR